MILDGFWEVLASILDVFFTSLLEVFGIIFERLEKTKHIKINMKIKRTDQNIEAHTYFKGMNLRLRKMSFAPTDRRPARKSRGGPGGRHAPLVKPRAIRATIKKSVGWLAGWLVGWLAGWPVGIGIKNFFLWYQKNLLWGKMSPNPFPGYILA